MVQCMWTHKFLCAITSSINCLSILNCEYKWPIRNEKKEGISRDKKRATRCSKSADIGRRASRRKNVDSHHHAGFPTVLASRSDHQAFHPRHWLFVSISWHGAFEQLFKDSRVNPKKMRFKYRTRHEYINLSIIWDASDGHLPLVKLLLNDHTVNLSQKKNNHQALVKRLYWRVEVAGMLLNDTLSDSER